MGEPLKATKEELRKVLLTMLQDARQCGVPDDGLATMLLFWTIGHLKGKTEVTDG
jgi:hypothetical protein